MPRQSCSHSLPLWRVSIAMFWLKGPGFLRKTRELEIKCFFHLLTASPKQSYLRKHSTKQMRKAVVSCDWRECFSKANTCCSNLHQANAFRSSDRQGRVGTWMRTGGWSSRSIWMRSCSCSRPKKEFMPVAGSTNDCTGTRFGITLPTQIQKRHEKTHCLGTCSECSAARCCTDGWIWLINMQRNAVFYFCKLHAKYGLIVYTT